MVRHTNVCGGGDDSGALAEGVWEYVNLLVKTYYSQEAYQYEVWNSNYNKIKQKVYLLKKIVFFFYFTVWTDNFIIFRL